MGEIKMMVRQVTKLGLVIGMALSGGALAQTGPGASVEWKVGPGPEPTVFYDAPAGYDKL